LAATVRAIFPIFPEKSPPPLIKSPRVVLLSYLTATMSRQAEKAAAVAARGAPRDACGRHGCGGLKTQQWWQEGEAPPVHLGA